MKPRLLLQCTRGFQSCTRLHSLHYAVILLWITFISFPAAAQPSGGPYGPVQQSYDLPKASTIYYVAPDGKADASGESLSKPTTVESAIEKVKTGDAIVMRGGTYRTGNLVFNQGITIQPYKDEQPVFKGTFVATEWKNLGNGLWKTSWSRLFPASPDNWWSRDRYGKKTPLHLFNNDMVFVDGKFLQSAGWEGEVDENSYYIDYTAKQVYIGIDPADRLVEITAFDVALLRTIGDAHGKKSDKKGPTIKGITFTQYAYRAIEVEGREPEGVMPESNYGKDVVGTTIEHCTLSFGSRVAAYLRGDKLTLRNCKVHDTSTEGIYIIGSSDVLLERNIFSRNNIERYTGYYPAAVKIFNQSHRVTCRDNLVIDLQYSNGIWYDVGEEDGVFINNWVQDVGLPGRKLNPKQTWPSDNGFFFEISKRAVVAGNVFVNCDQGIFILNSSNVQVYNNTFVNSVACIARNARTPSNDALFDWHSSTGPAVEKRDGHVFVNNLLVGDENFRRPLMFVWQPDSLCTRLPKSMIKQFDNNVFVKSTDTKQLLLWSPAAVNECQAKIESPESLKKLFPEFLEQSKYYTESIPLFKGSTIGNYELLPAFPGNKSAASMPSEISKVLGVKKRMKYIGAYPPME